MSPLSPTFIIAILLALSVHEFAHGYAAWKLGDPTAKYAGRLTLNPLAHLDMLGTLMFLAVGFGWGKPVPIDPRYFRNVKLGTTLTALAGPASNLLFAALTVALWKALFSFSMGEAGMFALFLHELLHDLLFINLGLMAFNLLPIAPLDGSKILAVFIPAHLEYAYEDFLQRGPIILLVLLIGERLLGLPLLVGWITMIVTPLLRLVENFL